MSYKTEEQRYWEDIRRKGAYFFGGACVLIIWIGLIVGLYAIWADGDVSKLLLTLAILFGISLIHCVLLSTD